MKLANHILKLCRLHRNTIFYSASKNNPNFGDVLSYEVVKHFSNRMWRKSSIDTADLICIGSILDNILLKKDEKFLNGEKLSVWGAGFIADKGKHHRHGDKYCEQFKRPVEFFCVRGLLTLKRLQGMGYDTQDIALGDPGLLASCITSFRSNKKYTLGIIAHYVDMNDPLVQFVHAKIPNSIVLNIFDSPLKLIKKISQCEIILSSAMHGLIVADSLGIPNQWIKISDKLHGNDYKFYDYYSVFGYHPEPWARNRVKEINKKEIYNIATKYPISQAKVEEIQKDILRSKPKKYFD